MAVWNDFELNCTDYLENKFGKYASFVHQGGADSTVADILVNTRSGKTFYIDAKHTPAQCGQFVLIADNKTSSFIYSPKNVNLINNHTTQIINHMNDLFEKYKEAGTAGKSINFSNCEKVFSNWVIENYKNKNVRYFITNNFTILPIEQFADYFEISANYRIKKSGSSSVGKKKAENHHLILTSKVISDFKIIDIRSVDEKLYVLSDLSLHNIRFYDDKYEYMFSARNNEYEVRKLSNTHNANVIFSIKYKNKVGISDDEFICGLK